MEPLNSSNTSLAEKALGGIKEVGKAASHASGALHCTGEAIYTDDVPLPPGTLHASLILAKTYVAFESISTDETLYIPGIIAVYTHQDIAKLRHDHLSRHRARSQSVSKSNPSKSIAGTITNPDGKGKDTVVQNILGDDEHLYYGWI